MYLLYIPQIVIPQVYYFPIFLNFLQWTCMFILGITCTAQMNENAHCAGQIDWWDDHQRCSTLPLCSKDQENISRHLSVHLFSSGLFSPKEPGPPWFPVWSPDSQYKKKVSLPEEKDFPMQMSYSLWYPQCPAQGAQEIAVEGMNEWGHRGYFSFRTSQQGR